LRSAPPASSQDAWVGVAEVVEAHVGAKAGALDGGQPDAFAEVGAGDGSAA
jgi:hypothetical protein